MYFFFDQAECAQRNFRSVYLQLYTQMKREIKFYSSHEEKNQNPVNNVDNLFIINIGIH